MLRELHPSLESIVTTAGMDPERLGVGIPLAPAGGPRPPRESVFLVCGEQTAVWVVPSLRGLFRGTTPPPDLEEYPPQYVPAFYSVEQTLLGYARANRVPTDREMEDVYGTLRRRPDGRSEHALHDAVWQAAALLLGRAALSEAEFTAIFARLARSAKKWNDGPTTRNYLTFLQERFGG